MDRRQVKAQWFANELRNELEARSWGARTLARHWRPETAESARRSIVRYLNGEHFPSLGLRRELAKALGLPEDRFEAEDDEEDEALAELLFALDRFVHERIRRARRERELQEARA